eukprot:m.141334 g.141334  ORF g.141334 m.141334 type:complete len:220 (-) comp15977_c6_seq1:2657-3316(-)
MAYYLRGRINATFLDGFTHTFLIRHPCKVAHSLWSKSRCEKDGLPNAGTGWTYFDVNEIGFRELGEIVDYVLAHRPTTAALSSPASSSAKEHHQDETTGHQRGVVIVDADELLANPLHVMAQYCCAVGLPFSENILSWQPGPVSAWRVWPGWHDDALQSDGIRQKQPKPPPSVDKVIADMQAEVCALPDHHEQYDWECIRKELVHAVNIYDKLHSLALK